MTSRRGTRKRSSGKDALAWALQRTQIGLSATEIEGIVRRAQIIHARAGANILDEGDAADLVNFLVAGAIAAIHHGPRGTAIAQIVGPGRAFGLASSPGRSESRNLGAVALVPSMVSVVSQHSFEDLVHGMSAARISRMLQHSWRALGDLLYAKCQHGRLSLEERIVHELRELAREFPRAGDAGFVDLPVTHQMLAQLVAASRSAVSRAVRRLCRTSRLVVHGGRFRLGARDLAMAPPQPHVPRRPGSIVRGDCERSLARRELSRLLTARSSRSGLNAPAVAEFVRSARIAVCEPDEVLPYDAESDTLAVLITGAMRIVAATTPESWIRIAGRGQFVGTPSSVGHGPPFFAVAHTRAEVAVLDQKAFTRLIERLEPAGSLRLLAYSSLVFSRYVCDACDFLLLTTDERLLRVFRTLAGQFPLHHDRGTIIDLLLSHHDLACLVRRRRENVSHALTRLRGSGRIEMMGRRFLVVGFGAGDQPACLSPRDTSERRTRLDSRGALSVITSLPSA